MFKSKKGAIKNFFSFIFTNKKAIGPVVAVSLLIVVTVGAVFSYNTWFKTYQSDLQTKAQTKEKSTLIVNKVVLDSGYVSVFAKTGSSYTIINKVQVNSNDCTLTGSNVIDTSSTQITTDCLPSTGKNTLFIHTDTGIYKQEFFI